MRYASGNIDDLNRIKQQMTMEAITQGTAEHIMHHVMINFILNGEMRFMQFDFTRESADTKNVFLFVEDYTDPQQQAFITTLRSIKNSAVLFCILSEEVDAKTTLCYDPVFITQGFAEGLGIDEPVNSPTFTIVQQYDTGRLPLYHFDVYRIGDISEMDEIGYEDCFYGDGVSLIEWSQLIEEILPEHVTEITIEKDLEKGFDYRKIRVEEK